MEDATVIVSSIGAVLGTLILSILGAIKANANMPRKVVDQLCHEPDDHTTSQLRSILRQEIAPLRRGQRRLARQVTALRAVTDALVEDSGIAEEHRAELSERLRAIEDSDDAAADQSTIRPTRGRPDPQAPRNNRAP